MANTRITAPRNRSRQPASARRTAAYDQTVNANVRPEKFFDSRVKLSSVCPETALMYAVLEDAYLCFHKQFKTQLHVVARAREAEAWFFSDDPRRLFSFVSVCGALGLEPLYIRKKLRQRPAIIVDWVPFRR